MTRRFEGRSFVVTGAAQGLGRRVAERAAAEGAKVMVADRSKLGEDVAQALRATGAEAVFAKVDLETWEGAEELVDRAVAVFGRVDVLVNNVGGTIWAKPYQNYEPAQIEAEIRRSLLPTLWGCRAVMPQMLSQGNGVIVNISSTVTSLSTKRIPYAAAKGGVNAITSALAVELADSGVRICGIAPGGIEAPPRRIQRRDDEPDEAQKAWYREIYDEAIDTSLMKRLGTLDEIAGAVLFVASDDASYITGTTIPVAGGHQG